MKQQTRAGKRSLRMFSAVLIAALAAVGCGSGNDTGVNAGARDTATPGEGDADTPAESDEQFTLQLSSNAPPTHPLSLGHEWLVETVNERSDGRLQIEAHYAAALCSLEEALFCVADGRTDMALVSPLVHPGELPLGTMATLPFVSQMPPAYAAAFTELFEANEAMQNEWEQFNQTVLGWPTISEAWLGSTKPINSLEDMRGLRVRGAGLLAEALAAAGADPVAVESTELYEGLQRGVLDAWQTALDTAASQGLHEVTDHWYDMRTGIYAATANLSMNLDSLNSLPADLQQILTTAVSEMNQRYDEEWHMPTKERDCEAVVPEVETLGQLPDDVVQEMQRYTDETIRPRWIESATEAGAEDPAGVLAELEELVAKHEAEMEEEFTSTLALCQEFEE